jgi:FkbM family methyltransferase
VSALKNRVRAELARPVSLLPPAVVRRVPGKPGRMLTRQLNRAVKRYPRSFTAQTAHGFSVAGDTRDLIQRYLYVFGEWEPNITAWTLRHLRAGDVVVDVGANIGYFSLLAATAVGPAGEVIAFEAVPSIATALEDNVARNGAHVSVRRVAAAAVPGSVEVFRAGGQNIGQSGTTQTAGAVSEGKVRAAPLSAELDPQLWPRIRLIKIDVEGFEDQVLDGLTPVLQALPAGAAVLLELSPDAVHERGGSAAAVLARMRALEFDVARIANPYDARSYLNRSVAAPEPLTQTPTTQTDLIFTKRGDA